MYLIFRLHEELDVRIGTLCDIKVCREELGVPNVFFFSTGSAAGSVSKQVVSLGYVQCCYHCYIEGIYLNLLASNGVLLNSDLIVRITLKAVYPIWG